MLKVKVNVKGHLIRTLFWLRENRFFYHNFHKHDWIATKLAHDGPHVGLHPGCAQGQGQGRRSRDTGTSAMSRNVYCTVPSDVLSLHALTLRSTVTLSFQYKCQTARCNVYIMEWATPSLTSGFYFFCTLFIVLPFGAVNIDWSIRQHSSWRLWPTGVVNFTTLDELMPLIIYLVDFKSASQSATSALVTKGYNTHEL